MPASSIPTTQIPSPGALNLRPRPLQSKTPWNTKSKKFWIHEFEITNLNTLSTGLDPIPPRVRGNQPPQDRKTRRSSDLVEDTLEYEVKEVLDSRVRNNKLEYLVDWVGYDPHDPSWEPAAYLDHAPEEIARYHERYPDRPSMQNLRTRPGR